VIEAAAGPDGQSQVVAGHGHTRRDLGVGPARQSVALVRVGRM
jgi:hypothetical protein